MDKSRNIVVLLVFILATLSCEQPYSPKPKGYFRIDLPEKAYVDYDSTFPYQFQYPVYASVTNDPHSPNEKYWVNIEFKQFNATLHLSYKEVEGNLIEYLEDAHMLVTKHIPKADAIDDSLIENRDRQVFGLTYKIEGSNAASPYQFFVTDSASHFVRGALYFNSRPNNDSLQPVINFLVDDIEHLINTLHWNTK